MASQPLTLCATVALHLQLWYQGIALMMLKLLNCIMFLCELNCFHFLLL